MKTKTKRDEEKRAKVVAILLEASQAWDVSPKGTIELKLIEKLADDILNL